MKRLLFLVFGVICAWFFVFVFGFADPSQFPEPWVWVIIPSAFTLAITCFAGAVMSPSDKFEWQLLFLFGMAVAGLNATFTCFFTFLVKFKDGGNSGRYLVATVILGSLTSLFWGAEPCYPNQKKKA